MLSRKDLSNKPFLQLILILTLCLSTVIIFTTIGTLAAVLLYGSEMLNIYDYTNPTTIKGLKLVQLSSAVGLFLLPPVFYAIIKSKKPLEELSLVRIRQPLNYLFILLLMFISTPFLSWVIELNANMSLPDFMTNIEQWMRHSEDQAAKITKAFLTFDGMGGLIYVLIIVAIVPAIGEELLFRGVLQKTLIQWTKKPHLAIWLTAILFSALHVQFFGFFPRMLLGVIFGYVFYWSKSLWLPILGHFINNGSVVLLSYFYPELMEDADVSIFNESDYSLIFYFSSFILSLFLMLVIKRINSTSISVSGIKS